MLPALKLWAALALAACLLDAAMGLWHGEGLRTMRQDGKLAAMALMLMAVLSLSARSGKPTPLPETITRPWGLDLRAALIAALAAQLVAAAWVGVSWPRSQLPMTAVPWATSVALTLAVFTPLALASKGRLKGLLIFAVIAGLVAVVASRSRAAWVVMPWILGLVVLASAKPWRSAWLALVVAFLAVSGGLLYDAQQPVQVERGLRLLDLWSELRSLEWHALEGADPGTSTGSRLLMWQAALDAVRAHPWTGIGEAGRVALVQQVVPPERMADLPPLVHVHQQFLNQAVDHGLPGLLAALLSAAGLFALALKAPPGLLRLQLLGVAVVHAAGLLFNANMTHGPYAFAVAATVAAAVLLHALKPGTEGQDQKAERKRMERAEHTAHTAHTAHTEHRETRA